MCHFTYGPEGFILSKQNQGSPDNEPFAQVFFQQVPSTSRLSALVLSPQVAGTTNAQVFF